MRASKWLWSCRGFRPRPAPPCREEIRREATAARNRMECAGRGGVRVPHYRVTWRYRPRPDLAAGRDSLRQTAAPPGCPTLAESPTSGDRPRRRSQSREIRDVSTCPPVTPWPCRRCRSGGCGFSRSSRRNFQLANLEYPRAKALVKRKDFIAALKRCATQNPELCSRLGLDCGFQDSQGYLPTAHRQLRSHSERKRDVARCDVPRLNAECDGHSQVSYNSRHHILQSVSLIRGLHAVEHFSEDDAANALKVTGQFQLHQHAVDLKGLGDDVFDKQNRTCGLNFVGRAQGCDQDRQASTVQDSFGIAVDDPTDTGAQSHIPRSRARKGCLPGGQIDAVRVCPVLGRHRPVESDKSGGVDKVSQK